MSNPMRSLTARITLLVFCATALSSLAVSWISLQSLDGFLREKIDQRFPRIVERISTELDQWYTLRTREVEVFSGSVILRESSPRLESEERSGARARAEAEQYLQYVLDSSPQFERLVIAGSDGRALLEVGETDATPSELLADSFASETTTVSDAYRLGDDLVQIVSAPLRDDAGGAIARLHAFLDLDRIRPLLHSDELGATADVFVLDRDRRYLNPPPGIDAESQHAEPLTRHFQGTASDTRLGYYDAPDGTRVVGAEIDFPRFGWKLVLQQPHGEAFTPVMASMTRVFALNLAIVAVVALAAFQIAGSIVKPLRALSGAARRLSEGEREVVIEESHSSEEVQLLTRTFNEMSHGLGRITRELEENHRAVEEVNEKLLHKNDELQNLNLLLEQLSITDGLTKLHNHRYFQETLARECKRSLRVEESLCLILIDIDFFKRWNDRLGHAGGDEILRRIAEVLNESVRETDVLARYGGEEFALLAIDTDLDGAEALGEKIRSAVSETNFVTDVPSEKEKLTVSIGIAALESDRKQLFNDADEALYLAKGGGRDRVVVARPKEEESDEG